MAIPVASVTAACSVCGEPMNAKGDCLACLLRTGLDKSVAEEETTTSLVFGDFEIARQEDGSLWELGRGAMGVTYLALDNVLRRKVALKVIEVPAEPADPDALPPMLKDFKAVPPLVTDINLSLDDRFLYVACWGTGEMRQYDVSDPFNPKPWRVACGGMVRLMQNWFWKSRSKSRGR